MERIYLDTSVFGGHFDPEFELWTKVLFEKIKTGHYRILLSRVIDIELADAPQNVRDLAFSIPEDQIEFIELTDAVIGLADQYIKHNVVGETSRADCLHIALATISNADIIVRWNFKHIVNVNRIRGYNSVNYRHGFKMIEIRTPREILDV